MVIYDENNLLLCKYLFTGNLPENLVVVIIIPMYDDEDA